MQQFSNNLDLGNMNDQVWRKEMVDASALVLEAVSWPAHEKNKLFFLRPTKGVTDGF